MGIILVFGNTNDPNGILSDISISRIEKVAQVIKSYPDYKIVVTGGYGDHFNKSKYPHYHYMIQSLKRLGVPDCNILAGINSSFTLQDIMMTRDFLSTYETDEIIMITSEFHASRVACFAMEYFFDRKITIIPVESPIDSSELDRLKKNEYKTLKKSINVMMGGVYE
ncbi:YdcF family protein [Vibrio sp.]|uniref:YdcF family protein n=1 Tax=Vibrio sp. TaxID=678 RepID=UPI00311FE3A5